MKHFAYACLFGALFGAAALSFISPRIVAWLYTPYSEAEAMCVCRQLASRIAGAFVKVQLGGLVGGLLLGVAAWFVWRRRAARRATSQA